MISCEKFIVLDINCEYEREIGILNGQLGSASMPIAYVFAVSFLKPARKLAIVVIDMAKMLNFAISEMSRAIEGLGTRVAGEEGNPEALSLDW